MSAPLEERRFEVGRPDHGARLDRFLCDQMSWASRARVRTAIDAGRVSIEPFKDPQPVEIGRPRPGSRLRRGQRVVVSIEAAHVEAGAVSGETGDLAEIPVVFEDDVLLAVSKPPSTNVYPTARHRAGSLIERLHRRHVAGGFAGGPPSPCHRLDRETSGLLLLAKERRTRADIGRQFEDRVVSKAYLAWVRGVVAADEGRIDLPLGPDPGSRVEIRRGPADPGTGQDAATRWRIRRREAARTLLELLPETGRQHQLRAHLASIGHPILGDRLYLGGDEIFLASLERDLTAEEIVRLGAPRLALHSWRLTLRHPGTGEQLELEAPPWPDLELQ